MIGGRIIGCSGIVGCNHWAGSGGGTVEQDQDCQAGSAFYSGLNICAGGRDV